MWVNEVFGPTLQGEGPWTGRRVQFLRLANCNLSCSWCDTPYSWDWGRYLKSNERREVTPDQLAAQLAGEMRRAACSRLVVSGGEPVLQAGDLARALGILRTSVGVGLQVQIESNGTHPPGPLLHHVDTWVLSPKLASAGEGNVKWIPRVLHEYRDGPAGAHLKVVCRGELDVAELRARLDELGGWPADRVWVMPEGTEPDAQLEAARELADQVLAHGWNLSVRVHTLLWGAARAR